MTIEVHGHIHCLEAIGGGGTAVLVTFQLEASRLDEPPHRVSIRAKPEEVSSYKIGMPVLVLVRPA